MPTLALGLLGCIPRWRPYQSNPFSTQSRAQRRVTCGVTGNGFVEIERALGNGLCLALPRESQLVQPAAGALKVVSNSFGVQQGSEMEPQATAIAAPSVDVTFKVPHRVELGEHIAICGASPEMGSWRLHRGLNLIWTTGHIWTLQTRLPPGEYEFKCVHVHADGLGGIWEPGMNRVLRVPESQSGQSEMEVTLEFGQTGVSSVVLTLRETVVVAPTGEELFRMSGRQGLNLFNHITQTLQPHPTPPPPVHDVKSYPLTDLDSTVEGFLKRELRLEEEEVKRMERRWRNLRFKSVEEEVQPWFEFMRDRIGMSNADMARLLLRKPAMLDLETAERMEPLLEYFVKQLGVNPDRFFNLLIRRPSFVGRKLEEDIKPKVKLLRSLTTLDDREAGRILLRCDSLMYKGEAEIRRRVDNVVGQLQLSRVQCAHLLLRFPPLLAMRPETLKRKIDYFTKSIGRSVEEILEFPFCLSYSLEKRIMKRFQHLQKNGVLHQKSSLKAILLPPEQRFFGIVEQQMDRDRLVECEE